VLAHLDTALRPADVDLPGYRLHPLKGDRKGYWSVSISGNPKDDAPLGKE
jgi:proteic killer suppression protein